MTYNEYKAKRQKEFDELPIFFAFSNKQLEEALNARGLTIEDTDKIYKLGDTGGFYLKTDAAKVRAFMCNEESPTLEELMSDHDFAVSAFRYEMDNHEYGINLQGDWDVCNCFTKKECDYGYDKTYVEYLTEAGHEDWISAYREAKSSHLQAADEGEWW